MNCLTSEYELLDVFKLFKLPIIEIYNTGHALRDKTKRTGWYASIN